MSSPTARRRIPAGWFSWIGWRHLVESTPEERTLLREYFGLQGCVIPIAAYLGDTLQSCSVLTLAGPELEKEFYFVIYGETLEECFLTNYDQPFSSLAEFFEKDETANLNSIGPHVCIFRKA
ncbi:hypothetical protein B0H10DRAFT_474790 [Mycena sp. CBHHK59/15]|nr:hypothetical protein B0H10DRAFT_474790 [Mycena sp. CBHHK59/15]